MDRKVTVNVHNGQAHFEFDNGDGTVNNILWHNKEDGVAQRFDFVVVKEFAEALLRKGEAP